MRGEGGTVTTEPAEKWSLDPGEILVAEARVQPPGVIEAQSGSNGFDLALTDRRLLISKRKALRNRNRASIIERISLDDIIAVRTEKRHPPATFGIPLYRVDFGCRGREDIISVEAGSFWVRKLERLAGSLIELRPGLATTPWPDFRASQPAMVDDAHAAASSEELQVQLAKAKRRLALVVAALIATTTVGIILWRSEDHPGGSFTVATIVLVVALQFLLWAWQLWEGIRRSTHRPEPPDATAPNVVDARCATFGRRMSGFLLDAVTISVFAVAVMLCFLVVAHPVFGADVHFSSNGQAGANVFVAAVAILFFVYPTVTIGRGGQSLGMRIMRIRLYAVTAGGALSPAEGKRVAGRSIIAMVFYWALVFPALIDYFWALAGPRHQCLHDKWSGTIALDIRGVPTERSPSEENAGIPQSGFKRVGGSLSSTRRG